MGAEEIQTRDFRIWRIPQAKARGEREADQEGFSPLPVQDLQEGVAKTLL